MRFYFAANHSDFGIYIFETEPDFHNEDIKLMFFAGAFTEVPEKYIPAILSHEKDWEDRWFGKYYKPQPKKRKWENRPLTAKLGELVNMENCFQSI